MSEKILCTICARGGSKGVPGKNVRLLQGKPLIAHSILQAKQVPAIDKIAVSSDDDTILDIARSYGADYLIKRPAEMASDTAAKLPAIRHAFLESEKFFNTQFDVSIDLDSTSPLRQTQDIEACLKLIAEGKTSNVITASPSRRSPYFNLIEYKENGQLDLCKPRNRITIRRQETPATYDMNASIYVWRRHTLLHEDSLFLPHTKLHIMPPERSFDIDEESDFMIVSSLAAQRADMQ